MAIGRKPGLRIKDSGLSKTGDLVTGDWCTKSGWTLLEVLVVIFLVGLFILGTVPSFFNYRRSANLNSAANAIISVFHLARQKAITSRSSYKVLFKEESFGIYKGNNLVGKEEELPSQIEIGEISPGFNPVVFTPEGMATPGHIIIKHKKSKESKKIIIHNITGRVKVE